MNRSAAIDRHNALWQVLQHGMDVVGLFVQLGSAFGEVLHHPVELFADLADLVTRRNLDPSTQVARGHDRHGIGQAIEATHDRNVGGDKAGE